MKTKGLFFACAKNALSVSMVLAFLPSPAQFRFASDNSTPSFASNRNFLASSLVYTYTAAEHAIDGKALPRYYYTAGNSGNAVAEKSNYPATAGTAIKEIDFSMDNYEISFRTIPFEYPENCTADAGVTNYSLAQLFLYAQSIKEYAKENDFDTSYAFLTNMGIVSDRKRFFVVNLATMEIEEAGLVAQGRGQGPTRFDKQYSNIPGSKCTSLGRYKILNKYSGEYGESYRLAGLDSTNDNAYTRNIVLHPMGCIPDEEEIMPACISEGCPAVSVGFLSYLSKIIDSSKKPVLLWIFDTNLQEAVFSPKPEKRMISEKEYALSKGYHYCSIHKHEEVFIP